MLPPGAVAGRRLRSAPPANATRPPSSPSSCIQRGHQNSLENLVRLAGFGGTVVHLNDNDGSVIHYVCSCTPPAGRCAARLPTLATAPRSPPSTCSPSCAACAGLC